MRGSPPHVDREGTGVRKLVVSLVLISVLIFALNYEEFYEEFVSYRDTHNVEGMKNLIERLEAAQDKDYKILTLLADAYVEYGLWGAKESEKESVFEKARKYAEEAIKLKHDYAYAYYVRGSAIGRLAQYKGLLKSLFMVDDFDYSMKKAMELDPKCFRAMIGMGMRYRDLPWPFRNYKKSEEYFLKALKVEPRYVNTYLELGILYKVWGKKEKAIEMFKKVLELPPMKGFTALGMEAKETAKKYLKELGAL